MDELLNGEIFYTLREAQIIIESWRRHYNAVRPHASLGYRPPAPECLTSALVRQIGAVEERGGLAHRSLLRSDDETDIRASQGAGRTGR